MRIDFYNFDFKLICRETRCISIRKKVLFNGAGMFEAHFPVECDAAKIVMENLRPDEGKMIFITDGAFSAVAVGYELCEDFALFGRTCNWLMSKRLLSETAWSERDAEDFAVNAFSRAFDGDDRFSYAYSGAFDKSVHVSVAENTDALTVVTKTLSTAGLGHKAEFLPSEKKIVFSVYDGAEVAVPARNSYDAAISFDILDYANSGYYKLNSVRTYLSPEFSLTPPFPMHAVLQGDSAAEARSSLADFPMRNEARFKLKMLKFGKDYNLGDTIRIMANIGNLRYSLRSKVDGVEILCDKNGVAEEPIFSSTGAVAV